ncbi:hypothetical protein C8R42DRAFT_639561 [Lentinula raphanica]|nr:hypothetical protein C8R42DRAFT_639561 [Lentinula raphanica]
MALFFDNSRYYIAISSPPSAPVYHFTAPADEVLHISGVRMYAFVDLKGRRVELERQGDSSQKGVSQYPFISTGYRSKQLDAGQRWFRIWEWTSGRELPFELERAQKFKPFKLETPSKSEKLEDLTNPREAGLRELGMYEAALARRRDVLETGLRGVRSSGSAWAPSTAARCLCPGLIRDGRGLRQGQGQRRIPGIIFIVTRVPPTGVGVSGSSNKTRASGITFSTNLHLNRKGCGILGMNGSQRQIYPSISMSTSISILFQTLNKSSCRTKPSKNPESVFVACIDAGTRVKRGFNNLAKDVSVRPQCKPVRAKFKRGISLTRVSIGDDVGHQGRFEIFNGMN